MAKLGARTIQVKHLPTVEVLQAVRDAHDRFCADWRTAPTVVALLQAQHPDWPEKVIVAKLEQLVERRFLDCGGTIRRAWLTEQGKAALQERMA